MKTLFYLFLAIGCCVSIVVILDNFDTTNEKEIALNALDLAPKPKKNSIIHYRYKDHKNVKKWTRSIVEFLKRKLPKFQTEEPSNVSQSIFQLIEDHINQITSNVTSISTRTKTKRAK